MTHRRRLLAASLIFAYVPTTHAQPADPTAVQLVPRSLSLEVDDPDVHIKKAANDVVNEVILTPDRFDALLATSYAHLDDAVARFNTTNYGKARVFLKGGNALRYAYQQNVASREPRLQEKCLKLFGQSDIDYAINTAWTTNAPPSARDFWLRDPTSNNEYGYQILNGLVVESMDKLRKYLLEDPTGQKIAFQDKLAWVNRDHPKFTIVEELNTNFQSDRSVSFFQKWADYIAAEIRWQDVPLPTEPIYLSHQLREFKGEKATSITFSDGELMGLDPETETKKYNDIRNIALPDKVILEGPTAQLLYSYQRNHHVSSIYLTSNYGETWPSDPTVDLTHYTKFALHRLKLALPFRLLMHKTDNASKPFKKLFAKSFETKPEDSEEENMAIDLSETYVANVLVAGGELVDVGVDHPSAAVLGHPAIDLGELVSMDVKGVKVAVAGYDWLLRDLKDVVFDIVGMPWKKKKFEKRAGRFMCMVRPTIIEAGALEQVRTYVKCLKTTSAKDCDAAFPLQLLAKHPAVTDFFVGIKDGKNFDPGRHSLRRVMTNLPPSEAESAKKYLELLEEYLQ